MSVNLFHVIHMCYKGTRTVQCPFVVHEKIKIKTYSTLPIELRNQTEAIPFKGTILSFTVSKNTLRTENDWDDRNHVPDVTKKKGVEESSPVNLTLRAASEDGERVRRSHTCESSPRHGSSSHTFRPPCSGRHITSVMLLVPGRPQGRRREAVVKKYPGLNYRKTRSRIQKGK